ncbi:MAG: ABC transporter substrate-binding protein [Acidobacteriota bacterium]
MDRLLVSTGVALCLGCAGCNRDASPVHPVRVAVHSDPISLDPHYQNEILTFSILANLYDGLTTFDSDLRVVPGLALRWENPDELTWRLYLRTDARFHNGRPVEAEDVVFTLERVRRGARSNTAGFLVEVDSVRALDTHTVDIRTRRPFGGMLNKLAYLYIVPRNSPDQITVPIGSGSYRFVSFTRGESLKLEPALNDWHQHRAELPLEFLPIRDPQERARNLVDGKVDIVQDILPSQVRHVQAAPGCRVTTRPSTVVEYFHMRVGDPRFADRRVREAIHLGLDRQLLVERMLHGYGLPATQLIASGVFGYDPTLTVPRRDVQTARRLLAEAGFPDGFAVTLVFRTGRSGEEIAKQLSEIGLKVTLESMPWSDVFERLKSQSIDFYYGGVAAPTADASDILDSFVHSRDPARGYGMTNFNGYASPELDRIAEDCAITRDMLTRRGLLQKGMKLIMQDLYLVPLFVAYDLYGIREDIEWEPHLDRVLLGREMRRIGR